MRREPFVSVIIPVFNDSERLARCLNALERQTWPRERYEIVVVDNGSEDDPKTLAESFPLVRWERELRPGSYAARNRGISATKGEVLAFTDSDCVPDRKWIAEGIRALSEGPDIGLAGGRIRLFFRDPRRLTSPELFERRNAFRHEEQIRIYRFAATANMFTWKSVVDRVGQFDDRLKSGGDVVWGNRVDRAGYRLVYAPAAVVGHPARRSFRELRRKTLRVVGGLRDWGKERPRNLGSVARDAYRSFRVVAGLIRRLIAGLPPSDEFETASEKIRYAGAIAFVEFVRNRERFRLDRGGASRR